ncbi:MAG: SMC-Scp complex subunit ScpB [Leptolyngbya sp. SIO1D8]|nr:SMC-Scp complex subunit ScpB [Leptolyngbya sp. SIO1D8]
MPKLASVIEAILYLKGRPLTISSIAEYAGCERDMAEEGLIELMDEYAHREGALEIVEIDEGYCLQLKSGFHHLVDTLIPLDLGVGALRTLAAIALRGPMAQIDLVDLRGSGAYQHVQELVRLGFVRKRRQADGRSFWLQVTNKFHQHFEIDQLPTIPQKAVEPSSIEANNVEETGISGSDEDENSISEKTTTTTSVEIPP